MSTKSVKVCDLCERSDVGLISTAGGLDYCQTCAVEKTASDVFSLLRKRDASTQKVDVVKALQGLRQADTTQRAGACVRCGQVTGGYPHACGVTW